MATSCNASRPMLMMIRLGSSRCKCENHCVAIDARTRDAVREADSISPWNVSCQRSLVGTNEMHQVINDAPYYAALCWLLFRMADGMLSYQLYTILRWVAVLIHGQDGASSLSLAVGRGGTEHVDAKRW